jgi:type IV fimbrial biogenesis protein FimT
MTELHPIPRSSRGVTLVELMVAIAVLGILVTFGAPGMQQLINGQRASSSANEVLSGLALARTEAIKRNTTIGFCMSATNRQWEVRAGGTTTGTANTTVFRQGDLSNTITATSANTSTVSGFNCVDYRSDGLPYSGTNLVTNGSFSLTSGNVTRNVRIRTGSIYVD